MKTTQRHTLRAAALGTLATLAVLGLSGIKGAMIALDYMELRHAPAIWRRAVMGWLMVVLGVVALASLVSTG